MSLGILNANYLRSLVGSIGTLFFVEADDRYVGGRIQLNFGSEVVNSFGLSVFCLLIVVVVLFRLLLVLLFLLRF